MNINNTNDPTSRTYDRNYVDYKRTINQVHDRNVESIINHTNMRLMCSKPILNPISNILNVKVTRAYPHQFQEGCTPLRPQNNHYPLAPKDVVMQRHIPMITH